MWPTLGLSPFAGAHWSALLDGMDTVDTPLGVHPGRRRPGLYLASAGLAPGGVLPFEAPAPLAYHISSAGAALPPPAPGAPEHAGLRRSAGAPPALRGLPATPQALRGIPVAQPAAASGAGGPDPDLVRPPVLVRRCLLPSEPAALRMGQGMRSAAVIRSAVLD